jgi:hypothetical protein
MITELKEWTKQKLISNPKFRDSNEKLYYEYLKEEGYDLSKNVKEFLKDMETRKIKYLDSISRASRLVQENNPYLRGKNWKKRKKKSIEVKKEIIDNKQ